MWETNRTDIALALCKFDAAPHLLCEVPGGDTILSFDASTCEGGESARGRVVILASAAGIWWYPLDGTPTVTPPAVAHLLCETRWRNERIIRVKYVAECGVFACFTASATVYCLSCGPCSREEDGGDSLTWRVGYVVGPPSLGVTLAVDGNAALSLLSAPHSRLLRVYSGTYSGSVCEWGVAMTEATALPLLSEDGLASSRMGNHTAGEGVVSYSYVPSHRPMAATFTVQIRTSLVWMSVDRAACVCDTLATCSDDRSVAVFQRYTPLSPFSSSDDLLVVEGMAAPWQCVWRGSGTAFSLSRIFDVDLLRLVDVTAQPLRTSFLLSVANEDGAVQIFHLTTQPQSASSTSASQSQSATLEHVSISAHVECVCRTPSQHSGHGVTCVCAGMLPSSGSLAHVPVVLSGGFDGSVVGRSLQMSAADDVWRLRTGCPTGRVGILPSTSSSSSRDRVRCITVTDALHILVCTEQTLCIIRSPHDLAQNRRWTLRDVFVVFRLEFMSLFQVVRHGADRSSHPLGDDVATYREEEGMKRSGAKQQQRAGIMPTTVTGMAIPFPSFCSCCCCSTINGGDDGEGPLLSTSRPPQAYYAVIGTASGEVVHVMYDDIQGVAHHDVCRRSTSGVSQLLCTHGKILQLCPITRVGGSTQGMTGEKNCVGGLCSSHVDGSLVLSVLAASGCRAGEECALRVLATCPEFGPGVGGLSLFSCWSSSSPTTAPPASGVLQCWTLCGDRQGKLVLWRTSLTTSNEWDASSSTTAATALCGTKVTRMQIFSPGMGISCISLLHDDAYTSSERGAKGATSILLTSNVGGTHTTLNLFQDIPEESPSLPPFCAHPLVFSENVSEVLAASSQCWITRCGTAVHFYTSREHSLWTMASEVQNVRAPRLLHARVASGVACMAHCSDGMSVEISRVPLTPTSGSPHVGLHAAGSTLLYGGKVPGKDFNCCCVLECHQRLSGSSASRHEATESSEFSHAFLLGNEDSTLIVHNHRVPTSTCAPKYADDRVVEPAILRGPHHSNILGISVLPAGQGLVTHTRIVSVGGSSTLVVWHFKDAASAPARMGRWRVDGMTTVTRRPKDAADACLPRFMGVCSLQQDLVAVASSDAAVRYFRFTSLHGPCEVLLEDMVVLDPSALRAVLCIALVTATQEEDEAGGTGSSVVLAGDSAGRMFVVEKKSCAAGLSPTTGSSTSVRVLTHQRIEACAINAVAPAHRPSGGQATVWETAAVTDSATVHLLRVTGGKVWALHSLCAIRIGITAGRGVAWLSSRDDIISLCDERVVRLRRKSTNRTKGIGNAGGAAEAVLDVIGERRVNIPCTSGLAVRPAGAGTQQERFRNTTHLPPTHSHLRDASGMEGGALLQSYEAIVVGQGVEVFYI